MHLTGSRLIIFAVAVVTIALCSFGAAWAQGYGLGVYQEMPQRSYDTTNLPSATVWAAEENSVWGEVRFFDGGNHTFAAGLRSGVGEGSEAQFTLLTMDNTTEDGAGDEIRSSGTLLGLNYKWRAQVTDEMTVSVMPGLDYPIGALKAKNTNTGRSASSNNLIPVISVPIEWQGEHGTTWRVVPRYVGFDSAPRQWNADGTRDGTVDGLGQCGAIGVGVLHEEPAYSLMADLQMPIVGDNAINRDTNEPTRRLVWSAGGTWHAPDSAVRVDLFATNALGPTGASSLMVFSDNATGVGLRVSGEF